MVYHSPPRRCHLLSTVESRESAHVYLWVGESWFRKSNTTYMHSTFPEVKTNKQTKVPLFSGTNLPKTGAMGTAPGQGTLSQHMDGLLIATTTKEVCIARTISLLNFLGLDGYWVSLQKAQMAWPQVTLGYEIAAGFQTLENNKEGNDLPDCGTSSSKGAPDFPRDDKVVLRMDIQLWNTGKNYLCPF